MGKLTAPTKQRRWRFGMTEQDFRALDFIGVKYSHRSQTGALRFCLAQEYARLQGTLKPAAGYAAAVAKVIGGVDNMLAKSRSYGSDEVGIRQWSCWLFAEDVRNLKYIMAQKGITVQAAAFRYAVRVQAELEGYKPDGGDW